MDETRGKCEEKLGFYVADLEGNHMILETPLVQNF